jgi:protein-S-isoprenylcysteine O-methyltransferase Ste14
MTRQNLIDRGEQLAALLFYFFLVRRVWPQNFDAENLAPAIIILSEGAIIFFLLIRRPTENISLRPQDWAVALIGTLGPLLVTKAPEPQNLAVGAFLLLFGMITQLSAKFSLRRSFGLVAANRGVKTGGAYRYVRHPMYLGYMISHVGFLLLSPSLWNFAVYAATWACLILRIAVEERMLTEDAAYQDFKKRVRFRLVPGLY